MRYAQSSPLRFRARTVGRPLPDRGLPLAIAKSTPSLQRRGPTAVSAAGGCGGDGEDGRLRPPAAGAGGERSEPPLMIVKQILTARCSRFA